MAPKRKAETQSSLGEQLKRIKIIDNLPAPSKANTSTNSSSADTTSTDTSSANSSEPPASLLTIAPELRNRIYEFALTDKDPIEVTRDLKEPGLLCVNRQIRSETRKMWFYQNSFEVPIFNCDPGLLAPFMRFVQPIQSATGIHVPVVADILALGPDWFNLMQWCRVVHRYNCAIAPMDNDGPFEELIISAHAIAATHRGAPWARCARALAKLRPVAGRLDHRWLVGPS